MKDRLFTQAEAHEILTRVVDRERLGPEGLSRSDLEVAAQELGMDPAQVEDAIAELDGERELQQEILRVRQEKRHSVRSSAFTWAVVNSGLFAVDVLSGEGWWFYWPLIAWTAVLLLQVRGLLLPNTRRLRNRAERRLQQRQREAVRRAQKERRKQSGKQFEEVIQQGVEVLLNAASAGVAGIAESRGRRVPEEQKSPPDSAEPARGSAQEHSRRS